jgi:hypothetical protein
MLLQFQGAIPLRLRQSRMSLVRRRLTQGGDLESIAKNSCPEVLIGRYSRVQ